MKRFIALLLCLVMVLSLAACGGSKTEDTQTNDGEEGTTTIEPQGWQFGGSCSTAPRPMAFRALSTMSLRSTCTPT